MDAREAAAANDQHMQQQQGVTASTAGQLNQQRQPVPDRPVAPQVPLAAACQDYYVAGQQPPPQQHGPT
eukprot:1084630-Pleurochrysis_carterae.AAC.1